MKVTVQNIVVDRDMVTKIGKQVWPWEVPVLEAKYGEGRVRKLDKAEIEIEALPDVDDEFGRLATAHCLDSGEAGTNQPYVEMAYGRGSIAKKALLKEIKASAAKRKPRKKASAKKPEPVKADDGDGDPLDSI